MAEFVMKELDKGESLHIESRATSSWEHGNPVHQGTQKILRKYAISFDSSKGSQQISRADFEFFDLVVGMDESNVEDLLQISAGRYDDKIKLFRPGVIILCALSLFLVTIKTQHSIKIDGTKITYKGQMQNHRLNGQGTLTYDNGDTYTGEFKNGSFNGQGTFKSHEGWIYQGEFKSGQADGQGKLTTENKVTYKGKFKQGIFKG